MQNIKLQQQAAEYLALAKYSEAIYLYEQSIEIDPSVMSNYWYLGLALLLQERETEAQLTWLSAITEASPDQLRNWTAELTAILTSEALQREAVFDTSIAWAIRQYVYQFAPENSNNLLSIILLSIELDIFYPYGKTALFEATKLVLSEQYKEFDHHLVLQVISRILDINPFETFIELCLDNQLINDAQALVAINNKLALSHSNLGIILYKQNSYKQAFVNFQKALDSKPDFEKHELAELKFNMGVVSAMQGKFEQAVNYFTETLELEPTWKNTYYQLVKAKYEFNNLEKGYQFTQDWFSRNIYVWEQHLKKLTDVPVKMLEIGSWEGRSTCWLLENILTHTAATITCIDTFEGSLEHKLTYNQQYLKSIEERFNFNIVRTGSSEKVQKIIGSSKDVLRTLPMQNYDILYIDGSHLASDVLEDAVISWGLVKLGGIIIFDDYDFTLADNPAQNTKVGIDAFITTYNQKINLLHQGYQVIVEKIAF